MTNHSKNLEIKVARDPEQFSKIKQQIAIESGNLLHAPEEVRPASEHEWLCGPATDGALGIGLLALLDGALVGFSEALRQEMLIDCPTADMALGVLQSVQRQGIGRALMAVTEQWATQIGLSRLQLSVLPQNESAIALYKSSGFLKDGESPRGMTVDGKFCTLIHMGKRLSEDERTVANNRDETQRARKTSPNQTFLPPRNLRSTDSELWRKMQPRLRTQTKWMTRTVAALTFDKATAAQYCVHIIGEPRFVSFVVQADEESEFIGSITGHLGSCLRDKHIMNFGIIVDKEWWGRGVGDALYMAFETAARNKQARRLSCDIAAGNHHALCFFKRHGFTREACFPRATTIEAHAMDLIRLGKLID